jgi:hypothetical protein
MMAGVDTICEECEGKRFEASVLDHHLGGRDISEVLAMSVTEARLTGRPPAYHWCGFYGYPRPRKAA